MTIDATTSTAASGVTSAQGQAAAATLSSDYDAFLQLLTAQIANQDPLEPMDASTFVSQLAQLSQVEQSILSNDYLYQINAELNAAGLNADLNLLCQQVTTESDQLALEGGSAEFSYVLAEGATSVKAVIKHADGTVVQELTDLPTDAGQLHPVTWGGTAADGLPVPDGEYSVVMTAVDTAGDPVESHSYIEAGVEQVMFANGLPVLVLDNGIEVSSLDVVAVQ